MATTYFGFICKHCNAAFPMSEDYSGTSKVLMFDGPYELNCSRCHLTHTHYVFDRWSDPKQYTEAELEVSRSYIDRITPKM